MTPGIVAATVVTAVRLIVSWSRTMYSVWPDEPAQLAMARLLGGGTHWSMHDHSTWRPGYALLLSPVYRLTDDAADVFRSAMVLNALLGGVATLLLVALGRRLTALSASGRAIASGAVMLAPAALFTTNFAWSESLLVPLFLATLLALVRFDEAPTLRRGVIAGAGSAAAFATHSRMLPVVAVVIGVVALALVANRITRRDGAIIVGVTVAGTIAAQSLSSALVARLWRTPAQTNTVGAVVERATDIGPLVVAAAGQWWYLAVTSVGVVGFGVWGFARRIRHGDDAEARSAAIIAVAVVACVALSVVFMSARERPDRIVYGRYNDAVITPVLVMGIATLVGVRRRRSLFVAIYVIGGSLIVAAGLLGAFRSVPLAAGNGVEPMILGLQPFIDGASSIDVVPITVAALALIVAVGGTALAIHQTARWKPIAALGLVLILAIGGVRTAAAIERTWTDAGDTEPLRSLEDGLLANGEPVDFYVPVGSDQTKSLMEYQFVLGDNEFTVIEDLGAGDARFVVAPDDAVWPDDRPARTAWDDPGRPIALWEREQPAR